MTTTDLQIKQDIVIALASCARGPLLAGATRLFAALGYESERRVDLAGVEDFVASFDRDSRMNASNTLLRDWKSVDMVFQLSGEELKQTHQLKMFETRGFNANIYKAFLFFAIDLREQSYTRTQLAGITREVNKLFQMPVSVLFRHGSALTLAIVTHRPNKTDATRDVLEKVSLIKDVTFTGTHRAHIEILADLALPTLTAAETIAGFDDLQQAWKRALDSSELNRRFFRELANWYFWAVDRVEFPVDTEPRRDVRNATGVIRLITRLMFVWFLREKRLVPDNLFDRARLGHLLTSLADGESTFYKAVLQNLFFATLNTEMRNPTAPRKFRNRSAAGGRDGNFMAHNLYRYEDLFHDPEAALALFADVPFLNGGLFECLDRTDDAGKSTRIDGFSDRPDSMLSVPNELFFSREHEVDLNAIYDTRGKHYKVRGLINILSSYKFTIAENTPIEEEIALDPELLGQVFENLLAAYNPETETTARKQTGSFYTPREIVNYMVDESLLAYLEQHLISASRLIAGVDARPDENMRDRLRHLLAYTNELPHFNEAEIRTLIMAIDSLTILDPACGSGAFPMGILHKLVHILSRLDPGNRRWKQRQIDRAQSIPDALAREAAIDSIDEAFERNELDYGRKLFLIENCIYGVDIQPVAVQIAKLRCFIALIVDEKIDDKRENRGVRPLPNLETKFVAANTLVSIPRTEQLVLRDPQIDDIEIKLHGVRSRHFNARTPRTKAKYREQDKALRKELAGLLRQNGFARATISIPGFSGDTATLLANWDPYDQNVSTLFFDIEWMFGIKDGFDIVIANPPYVRQEQISAYKPYFKEAYPETYSGTADLFVYFFHQGMKLLRSHGLLVYIASNSWLRANYAASLRAFLRSQVSVEQLIDLGDNRVFPDVPDVYPAIIVTRRVVPIENHTALVSVFSRGEGIKQFAQQVAAKMTTVSIYNQSDSGWQLGGIGGRSIFTKLTRGMNTLIEVVDGQMYRGVTTGFNEAFYIDKINLDRLVSRDPSCSEIIKHIIRGEDLRPWYHEEEDRYLIFTRRGIDINSYPSVKLHLEKYKLGLEPKPSNWDSVLSWKGRKPGIYKWYEIQDTVDYYEAFEKKKIVWTGIAKYPRFSWDDSNAYINDAGYIAVTDDPFILGILQSRVSWFNISQICLPLGERAGTLRYQHKIQFISRLPIPEAPVAERRAVSDLAMIITAESKSRYTLHQQARNHILTELGIPEAKLNQKLTAWWNLDFAAFRDEVRKVFKHEIGARERDTWEAWLAQQRQRHAQYTAAIIAGEIELNVLVYQLFDLDADEIRLIEESTKYRYGEI